MVTQRGAVTPQGELSPIKQARSALAHNLDAMAAIALDEARGMPPGDQRTEALNKAMILRNAVELHEFLSGKPAAPAV